MRRYSMEEGQRFRAIWVFLTHVAIFLSTSSYYKGACVNFPVNMMLVQGRNVHQSIII